MEDDHWLYNKVVFAGTFDRLHEGHKHIMRTAFKLGRSVAIGLTTDHMLRFKTNREIIQSYEERYCQIEDFLKDECDIQRASIFPINTREGGGDTMEDLEALIVSDEIGVVQNAFDINQLRIDNGLRRFHIVIIPMVRTQDGRPLSSSRIRSGENFENEELIY
ncbi:MAG: pantetheine-phosphate adenylyltransferase [Candidatus Thorarchaeota archaeon]|nr:pantetheine-phosphate adenylyltransferase [Candidatus Thorarchaeota archaeon]